MTKITATILGLSLTLAAASLSFAAQGAQTPASGTTSTTTTQKQHVKKHKKAATTGSSLTLRRLPRRRLPHRQSSNYSETGGAVLETHGGAPFPAVLSSKSTMEQEIATLGGGCFWCLEAVYREAEGVISAVSGYMGGASPNPSYKEVCSGRSGHVEVVQVTFDPAVISYREYLEFSSPSTTRPPSTVRATTSARSIVR